MTRTIEVWRACLDGDYEISSEGRIRRAIPGKGTRVGRVMAPQMNSSRYLGVTIRVNGRPGRTKAIHRLVAAAFIGPIPRGKEVNHRDGNKQNNRADNLEYVTRSENCREAIRLGLRARMTHPPPHVPGERNGRARLTAADVRSIRRRRSAGQSIAGMAREYGVSATAIGFIVRRVHWRHIR